MLKETAQYSLANASLVEDGDEKINASPAAVAKQRDEYLVEQLSKAKSENLQYELKIINLQNDIFRMQTKHKEFSRERASLLTHIEQLHKEKTQTDSEIEQINLQRAAQEQGFSALKEEILNLEVRIKETQQEKLQAHNELDKLLSMAKQKEQFLQSKINDLNKQEATERQLTQVITEKESQINQLSAEVKRLNQTIQSLANNDGNKGQLIERYRHERSKYEIALFNTKKDLQGLINELEKVDTQKATLEKNVEKAHMEIANLRQEINNLKATLSTARENNARLETDNKNLTRLFERSEAELNELKRDYNILLDESKRTALLKTVEAEKLASAKNQVEANLSIAMVKFEDVEDKLSEVTVQCEQLEKQKIKLINDLSKKTYDYNELYSTHAQLVEEYNEYKTLSSQELERQKNSMALREGQLNHIFKTAEADYQTAQQNVNSLRHQLSEAETQKFAAETRFNDKVNELEQEKANQAEIIAALKKELDEKRTNYNKFTAFFETERDKANKVLSQLTVEIKHSIALHPLKDYLQATESELARIELEVKKLPYDAANRRALETKLEQLFEQRNTTRDLIRATEKHLLAQDTKANHLMSYIDSLQVPKKL